MMDADSVLAGRARRAYERGRVYLGLRAAAAVAPMAGLSLIACGRPAATFAGSLALAALATSAVWWGRDVARGARLGLVAGLPPLLLPVLVEATGHVCAPQLCLLFPGACIAGGLIGGLALGFRARKVALSGSALAVAALVAGLTGSLGCLVAGAAGLMGLILGLASGVTPVLVVRRV
jgi:hypothetical protein